MFCLGLLLINNQNNYVLELVYSTEHLIQNNVWIKYIWNNIIWKKINNWLNSIEIIKIKS